jgi:O-succinylbenzoate synthase
VSTLPDFEGALTFVIPMVSGAGDGRAREGMLIEGPQGWGEFSPLGADDRHAARWLTAATEAGTVGWPDPVRGRIPVAVTVPAIAPDRAHALAAEARGRTVEVAVAAKGALGDAVARVEAVRDAIGPDGAVRCTVDGAWDVDTAVATIAALEKAAGGLEFVEQPCLTVEELAAVRRKVDVKIALDVSARHAYDPLSVPFPDAADVVVLKSGPLGGVRRALRVAELSGLPCVVSSSLESSVGLAGGLALAGALPELPFACGLGTVALLTGDLVTGARSLRPVDGWLPVAPMPPAPDPDRMGPFIQTDPERVAWWRALLQRAQSYS